jgi:hypothetical protein
MIFYFSVSVFEINLKNKSCELTYCAYFFPSFKCIAIYIESYLNKYKSVYHHIESSKNIYVLIPSDCQHLLCGRQPKFQTNKLNFKEIDSNQILMYTDFVLIYINTMEKVRKQNFVFLSEQKEREGEITI